MMMLANVQTFACSSNISGSFDCTSPGTSPSLPPFSMVPAGTTHSPKTIGAKQNCSPLKECGGVVGWWGGGGGVVLET